MNQEGKFRLCIVHHLNTNACVGGRCALCFHRPRGKQRGDLPLCCRAVGEIYREFMKQLWDKQRRHPVLPLRALADDGLPARKKRHCPVTYNSVRDVSLGRAKILVRIPEPRRTRGGE
jgi:hypothetical protein